MALEDAGYFLVNRTLVYTADVDTAAPDPDELDTPPGGWSLLGHIGDETADGNVSFTRDGGDVTTKGSISKRAIRQVVEPVNTGVEFDVTQLTRVPFTLYHGTAGGVVTGVFSVTGEADGGTTEKALLVVWEDGTKRVGLYAPKASFSGRDNIDTDSIEDAIRIPLRAGFLDSDTILVGGKPLRYDWISPTLLAIS
jgi:hypothetical protein